MAQTNYTPIQLYYSTTASAVPTSGNLANGELGLNIADMKLYAKNSAGTVTLLASNSGASGTVSSVSGTGTVNGLTLTGTVTTSGSLTLGGTLSLVSPPPIGSTTPNTGAFSSLTVNGGLLFNANGDSSSATGEIKQLTGSGLTIYSKTGSSYDFTLLNAGGSNLIRNPTGTSNVEFPQTSAWFTGTGLGIGATSPVARLHIRGTGTSGQVTSSFILENASSGTAGMDVTGTAGASRWRFLYGGIPSTGTNTLTESMCIITEGASAGNVGIGTSSPANQLTVYRTSASTSSGALLLDGNGNYAGVQFARSGTVEGSLSVDNATMYMTHGNSITFRTGSTANVGGTDRFVIGAAGQFGLSGANYGTAGEVLTSGGSGAAPTWAAAAGGISTGKSIAMAMIFGF